MKTRDKVVIFLAIFALFTCLTDGAEPARIRRVLVLNSYHPTYEWTKLVVDGIESTLQQYSDRIEMDIEYMDTKHFENETHYGNLYALYKHKARQRQYDVIITSDDDALSFVLQHRPELYPNVPVVFCGVGRLSDFMLEGQSDITGVVEERSVASTVEIALKLHPSARQVVFVKNGQSGKSPPLDKELEEIIQRFEERVEFVQFYLYEFNTAELLKIIGGLGDESIVVFTSSFKDAEGNLYGFEDEAAMLSEQCLAPIYVISEVWLGIGPVVVGGKVSSASHQGRTAAEMAIRILDGENVRNIPIVRDSPHRYMFDHIQMKRFGITVSDLPEASRVLNEPKSFYYLYKRQIWAVGAIIAALTTIVMILSVNTLRRKQAERKLFDYQRQLKSLASQLSLTEELERRRIAIELHDRISQFLVISKVKLETLCESAPGELAKAISEVCDSLDQTIQNTRLLTSDLSSPILYELGFEAAVSEWLAEQIQQKHGITTEFEDDGQSKPLDENIRVLLFRDVRELLINVVKHAQAHKVKVSVRKVGGNVHVSVEDDGVGFDFAEVSSIASKTGGFGLFSIRERLEQLEGYLEVESKPGHGTRVTLIAPLKHEEDQNTVS